MEIPPNSLEKLKCSRCENYLSRGPIYLEHDVATICGRCFSPERPSTRIECYETVAKLLLFPCKNRDLGCLENVPFVNESEIIGHEEVCPYRQYVCPILGSAHCEWVGSRTEVQKHSVEKHLDRLAEDSITLTHDISKTTERNFLLLAFKVLFLLHIKVCVESGKIYHAVRFLGQSNEAANFTFKTDIRRNGQMISKNGNVLGQGSLVIQEDVSQVLDTNGLINVLDGYEGTTFTITVEKSASAQNLCAKCGSVVTALTYRTKDGWCCLDCSPAKVNCEMGACTHNDIPVKKLKHFWYFCEYADNCYVCDNKLDQISLLTHYGTAHQNETYKAGSTWQIEWKEKGEHVLLTCVAGTAVCEYFKDLEENKLILKLHILVTSDKLHEFHCTVRLSQSVTGIVRTYKPETQYKKTFDWLIKIAEEDFPNTCRIFNIYVDITQTTV